MPSVSARVPLLDPADVPARLIRAGLRPSCVWWSVETLGAFAAGAPTLPHRVTTNAFGGLQAAELALPPPGRAGAWRGFGYALFGVEVEAPSAPLPAASVSLERVEREGAFLPLLRWSEGLATISILGLLFGVWPADAPGIALLEIGPGGAPMRPRLIGLPAAHDARTQRRASAAWRLLHEFTRETRGRQEDAPEVWRVRAEAFLDWKRDHPHGTQSQYLKLRPGVSRRTLQGALREHRRQLPRN